VGTFNQILGKRLVGGLVGAALVLGGLVVPASHVMADTSCPSPDTGTCTANTYNVGYTPSHTDGTQTIDVSPGTGSTIRRGTSGIITIVQPSFTLRINSDHFNSYFNSIKPTDVVSVTYFSDSVFEVTVTRSGGVPVSNWSKAPFHLLNIPGVSLQRYEGGVWKKINKVIQFPGLYRLYTVS